MALSPVTIQITPEERPSTPAWMGEVVAFAQVLIHTGTLKTIQEQVRFARARFGTYESLRFCRCADRLYPFRRTNEAFLLRTARSVCLAIYGLVWSKSVAPSLDAVTVSCSP